MALSGILVSLILGRLFSPEPITQTALPTYQMMSPQVGGYYDATQQGRLKCVYPQRGATLIMYQADIVQNNRGVCLPNGEEAVKTIPEPRECSEIERLCAQKFKTYTTNDPEEIPYDWAVVFN